MKSHEVSVVITVLLSSVLFFLIQSEFPEYYISYLVPAVITYFCIMSLATLFTVNLSLNYLLLIIITIFISGLANKFVLNMNVNFNDAKYGISNTTYYGHSINAPLTLSLITVLIGVLVGLAIFQLNRKFRYSTPTLEIPFRSLELGYLSVIGFALIYVGTTSIHLASLVRSQINSLGSNQTFDFLNFTTWQIYHEAGFRAMKDFWYPYGGMIWFQDFEVGPLLVFLFTSIMCLCISYVVIKGRTMTSYQFVLILILTYLISTEWWNSLRYGFPFISLIMLGQQTHSWKLRVAFGIPLSLTWWLSPEISFLSFIVFVFEIIRARVMTKRELSESGIPWDKYLLPAASLACFLIYSANVGTLAGTFRLFFQSSEVSQLGSSIDFGLGTGNLGFKWSNLALQLILIILIAGLVQNLKLTKKRITNLSPTRESNGTHSALILFMVYFLLKDSTRTGMLTPALICLLLFQLLESPKIRIRSWSKHAVISGITAIFLLGNLFQPAIQNVSEFSSNIRNIYSAEKIVIAELGETIDTEVGLAKKFTSTEFLQNEIFVLGDRSTFYWGIQESPFWTTSNWSPYSAQERLLSELAMRNPRYVYLDKRLQTLEFDRVPAALRNASTYRWVMNNYTFKASLAEGDLLVQFSKGKRQIDWKYWNDILGSNLNIGYLGNTFAGDLDCNNNRLEVATRCKANIYISEPLPIDGIGISCGNFKYTLMFSDLRKNIVIPTNRIWFWRNNCKVIQAN
jgi:hypothetical protein